MKNGRQSKGSKNCFLLSSSHPSSILKEALMRKGMNSSPDIDMGKGLEMQREKRQRLSVCLTGRQIWLS